MQKTCLLLTILLTLLTPSFTTAATQVGFVEGLWFSTDTFIADEPLRIYAAVRNHTSSDITGTVSFYVNNSRIKQQPVSALDNRVIEAWADWTPIAGTHAIRATFSDITLDSVTASPQLVENSTRLESTITVSPPPEPPPPEPAPAESAGGPSATSTASYRSGLETYLAPSRAKELLTRVTDWSNRTRQAIEERQARNASSTKETASTLPPAITTVEATSTPSSHADDTVDTTFFTDMRSVIENIFTGIYHTVLNGGAALFARPALIQFFLLLGILYSLYRTARYFGRRP